MQSRCDFTSYLLRASLPLIVPNGTALVNAAGTNERAGRVVVVNLTRNDGERVS